MERAKDSFADVLRAARRAADMSQEALAGAAGLGLRTVQELERGRARPRRETLRRLATALRLPLEPWLAYAAPGPQGRRRLRPQTGVPSPRTSLVARERELATALARLRAARLLTLVGPGGVGKTRLAVELVARARQPCTAWVELAAGADPVLQLATHLETQTQRRPTLAEAVVAELAERQGLVVLDSCEHCLEACVELARRLLDRCPRLSLLCTSREPLRMYGEAVLRVEPLSVPTGGSAADVVASAAGRLFAERATFADASFALDDETAPLVAELCARLDGLPLSLELAAAALARTPLHRLAEQVRAGEALSLEGFRDSPERHRTLRQMLAWSHDLLAPDERRAFRRLAVFAGSFAADAAGAVCGDTRPLARLVDASLVAMPDPGRFQLLDTVRDYALELLRAAGEEAETRQRHLAFYAAQSERAADLLQGPEQEWWIARLDADAPDIWAAARWATAAPRRGEPGRWERVPLGQPLLSRLWRYWFLRGSAAEAYAQLRHLLDGMGPVPETAGALRARAFGLGSACVLAWHLGESIEALRLGEESLRLRRRLGDDVGADNVILALGIIRAARGEYRAARELLERSLAEGVRHGDAQMVAFSSLHLGHARTASCDRAGAEAAYAEALGTFEKMGDAWGAASALHGWGVLLRGSDLKAAARRLEESVSRFRERGDRGWAAQVLADLGRVRHLQGDRAAARALLAESEALAAEAAYAAGRAGRSRFHALLLWDDGEPVRAAAYWRSGLAEALAGREVAVVADHLLTAAGWLAETLEPGQAGRLVELLAAAATLRASTRGVLPREERPARRRAWAAALQATGAEAAAAAWRRGRSATLEQAAGLAERLLDETLAATAA
ncbi:MAG TPA: helix-turn-helix domain-containing protein [Gaiellaceae bacterium]|nr:helix-turn-helix domain-containing protein [Gaiellaceae bacterium]